MRRGLRWGLALQPLLLLLLPVLASADGIRYYPAMIATGGVPTFPLEGETGCTTPAFSFTDDTGAGLCLVAADQVVMQTAPSGGSRSLVFLDATSSIASLRFYDAAAGITSFDAGDDVATVFTNGLGRLVITTTLGSFTNLDTVVVGSSSAKDPIQITPAALGAGSFAGTITSADLTGARTWTLPNNSIAVSAEPTNTDGCISISVAAGVPVLNIDTTCVLTFSSGTGAVSATGAVGTFYFETDRPAVYTYPTTDAETVLLSLPAGTGTSGGIPYFTATADVIASSAALTANLPVIGGGAGVAPSVGTRSGNSTAFVTTTGAQTSGRCVEIDANGNHIASTAACGGYDPSLTTHATWRDEFTSALTTDGNIGDLNWQTAPVGAGTSLSVYSTPSANHPGILRLTTGTNDNAGSYVVLVVSMSGTDIGAEEWSMTWIIRPEDAVTDTYLSVGLAEGGGGAHTSAIRAFYDSDHAHASWIFQICDSSTSGCQSAGDDTNADTVASTKVPTAGTWQAVKIRRCATCGPAGVAMIGMSVGDAGAMETEKTFCSASCDSTMANLPTADLLQGVAVLARAATTSKDLDVDLFYMTMTGLVRF